jgi:hypothetical protein
VILNFKDDVNKKVDGLLFHLCVHDLVLSVDGFHMHSIKIFGDELRRQIMALREFILIFVLYLHPFSVFLVKHLQFVLNSLPTKRTFNKGHSSLYLTHLSVKGMSFRLSSLKKALHFLQLFPTNFRGRFYKSYRAVNLSN